MKLYYPITVDLYNLYPLKKMTAQQNNIGRGAMITLTAAGAVIDPTGETVNLYARKPDGTVSYLPCTAAEGKIKVDFTNQMLSVPGEVQVELQMLSGQEQISTPIFILVVQKSNIDSGAVESTNEFTALQQALAEVQELKAQGLKGDPGEAATIQVGIVAASEPGGVPVVTNSGTQQAAVLNFVLPRGEPGSVWYYGTAVSGTSISGTVFPDSGIADAEVYDKYINTDNGNIYNCVFAGDAAAAQWGYIGNIMGPAGATQIVFSAYSAFPETGDTEKIYVDTATTDKLALWRWTGSAYVTVKSSDIAVIADPYNSGSTYSAGDYCTYFGRLWKSNQAISAAEPWTPEHWTQTTVGGEISALNTKSEENLGNVYAEKAGNVVTVLMRPTSSITASKTGWNTIATLPENYRPKRNCVFPILNNNVASQGTSTAYWGLVSSTGEVSLYFFSDKMEINPAGTISYTV